MKHRIKSIFRNLKKIPFFLLLCVTLLLFDGVDDGILPWPSPFHISLAHSNGSDDAITVSGTADRVSDSGQNTEDSDHSVFPSDSRTEDTLSGGSGTDIGENNGTNENTGNSTDGNTDNGTDGNTDGSDAENDILYAAGTSGSTSTDPDSGLQQADSMASPEGPAGAADGNAEAQDPMKPILGEDGLPLVQYMQVEDDYFDDAVFIGDSRTRSLELYANLEHTTFLADTGLTIYTVLDKKLTPSTMNSKTTVTDYLSEHQFKKIYLMLGINELGTGTAESFCRSYGEVLDTLRELQPDAIIYLQAILHISESKDKEHTYINNAAIIERNEALRSLADNEHVFWLDSNPAVCDEAGYLIDSYTFDGVHLQAKYVYLWTDYLKQNAVLLEDSSIPQSPFPSPQPQAMP